MPPLPPTHSDPRERFQPWNRAARGLVPGDPATNEELSAESNPTWPLEMEFPLLNVPPLTNSQILLKLNVIPHNARANMESTYILGLWEAHIHMDSTQQYVVILSSCCFERA